MPGWHFWRCSFLNCCHHFAIFVEKFKQSGPTLRAEPPPSGLCCRYQTWKFTHTHTHTLALIVPVMFVLSVLMGPQICFIHGLTSSACQPLNNWRNYQALGSKAPQKCVMPQSKAVRKEKRREREGGKNRLVNSELNPVMFLLHKKKRRKVKTEVDDATKGKLWLAEYQ